MTIVRQDLTSLANGVAIAVGDAASPSAFYSVTKTGGTIVRDNAPGTTYTPRWAKFVLSSTAQCNMVLQGTAGHQQGQGVSVFLPTYPSSDIEIIAIHTAGPTYYLNLFVTSTGHIKLMYSGSVIWTSTGTLATANEYFIYVSIDNNSTTATYTVKTYAAGSGSPIANLSYSGTYGTVGTGSPSFYSFGVSHTGSTSSYTYYLGWLSGDNTLTEIGPYSTGSASAGPDISNIEPYSTVTLDGSASSGSTFAWTYTTTNGSTVTITNANQKVASYVAPPNLAGESILFTLTVDGAVQDFAIHNVLPHNTWVKQGSIWVPGRWM